jgi:hypothetical protein
MRGCEYLEWERERKVLLERWERNRRDRREGGRKMGEERCESKRETTQVSSSVVVRWKGGRKVERTYVDILFSLSK